MPNFIFDTIHQKLNQQTDNSTTQIDASVLLIISDEPTPRLLFSKRSDLLKHHAGEVGLIGGKKDDDDLDITHTALREAQEEIALAAKNVHILGSLPIQYSKAGLSVRPLVAQINHQAIPMLHPNQSEIARLFWVDLDFFVANPPINYVFLLDKNNHPHHPNRPPNTPIIHHLHTPAWVVDGEVIWGLTGRVLLSFLQLIFNQKIDWYYRLKRVD